MLGAMTETVTMVSGTRVGSLSELKMNQLRNLAGKSGSGVSKEKRENKNNVNSFSFNLLE